MMRLMIFLCGNRGLNWADRLGRWLGGEKSSSRTWQWWETSIWLRTESRLLADWAKELHSFLKRKDQRAIEGPLEMAVYRMLYYYGQINALGPPTRPCVPSHLQQAHLLSSQSCGTTLTSRWLQRADWMGGTCFLGVDKLPMLGVSEREMGALI